MSGIRRNRDSVPAAVAPAPIGLPPIGALVREAVERSVVPQLLARHAASPPDPSRPAGDAAPFSARLAVELAMDAAGADPARMQERLDRLLEGGADPAALCLEVLAPAARHLGHLWVEDELSFVDVTLGSMRLERALRALLPRSRVRVRDAAAQDAAVGRAPSILLMPLHGNQHTLGPNMAAEFFRRAGWIVSGSDPDDRPDGPDELERHLRLRHLDAVGFSASCEVQIELLSRAIALVRAASCNRRIRIVLGGPLFAGASALRSRFDADLVCTDAAEAPFQAAALLPDAAARLRIAAARDPLPAGARRTASRPRAAAGPSA